MERRTDSYAKKQEHETTFLAYASILAFVLGTASVIYFGLIFSVAVRAGSKAFLNLDLLSDRIVGVMVGIGLCVVASVLLVLDRLNSPLGEGMRRAPEAIPWLQASSLDSLPVACPKCDAPNKPDSEVCERCGDRLYL